MMKAASVIRPVHFALLCLLLACSFLFLVLFELFRGLLLLASVVLSIVYYRYSYFCRRLAAVPSPRAVSYI